MKEKLELIKLRREILQLLGQSNLRSTSHLTLIGTQLKDAGQGDLFPELKKIVSEGYSISQALERHSVLGNFIKKSRQNTQNGFLKRTDIEFLKIAINKIKDLKEINSKDFLDKIKNETPTQNIANKYFKNLNPNLIIPEKDDLKINIMKGKI